MDDRRVISTVVVNEHGVLSRIAGLFSGRGYNIESLTVAPIPDTNFSRISIVTFGNIRVFEQIVKQLHKLIPVYCVVEHSDIIQREAVMVKVSIEQNLSDIEAICKIYNGYITSTSEKYAIAIAIDNPHRIENFLKAIKKFKPKDIVRGGTIALERG